MDDFKPYKQDWYVVFADSGYKSTVLGWLRPGFKHCYAMRKTEANISLHISTALLFGVLDIIETFPLIPRLSIY